MRHQNSHPNLTLDLLQLSTLIPCYTQGGTDTGVMRLIGRTLRDVPDAVCIGITPWGAVRVPARNCSDTTTNTRVCSLIATYH